MPRKFLKGQQKRMLWHFRAIARPGQNIPPDLPVVVSAGARLFHVAGCEAIHNKDKERTLTAKEAMREGYVPCTRCLRMYLNVATRPGFRVDERNDGEEVGVAGD